MRIVPVFVVTLVIFGLFYRLWPLLAGMPLLSTFFIIEDGYITLTVARNIATGLGMTVSDGTIPTNGVQPLSTLLFALPYIALAADKVASLYLIHLMLAGFGLAAFLAVHAVARRILPEDTGGIWPWCVALLWFLGPLLLRHSMNGLETGLYTACVLCLLLLFHRLMVTGDAATTGQRLLLGAFCGLTVLARIDAVFLVTALFLVWAWDELFIRRNGFATMLARLVPPGVLSLLVAGPWFVSNFLRFGSIMPISGTSQSHLAGFGSNAGWVPVKLFETMMPMLPVPRVFEQSLPVQVLAMLAVVTCCIVLLVHTFRKSSPAARRIVTVYMLFAVSLATYYGLFFGAPHFLGRYFAPLAPLLILAALVTVLQISQFSPQIGRFVPPVYLGVSAFLCALLLGRALLPGVTKLGHEQVLAWTASNVPDAAWVAAAQTGALGYWHDRTINLDGKTNINALQAHWRDGHILNYVVEGPADYVIDWAAAADWHRHWGASEGFADAFEVAVEDPEINLGVLRRGEPRYRP